MNKWMAPALVAGMMAVSAPAMAATPINLIGDSSSAAGIFGQVHNDGGFTDEYSFNVPGTGTVGASVITLTLTGVIKLTSVLLNNNALNIKYDAGNNTYSAVGFVNSQPNPQSLVIGGSVTGGVASYSGNVSFTKSAVPEPATWALMILGFGVVGYAMRRRPSVRFAQAV
jgi:hypothetical protein